MTLDRSHFVLFHVSVIAANNPNSVAELIVLDVLSIAGLPLDGAPAATVARIL